MISFSKLKIFICCYSIVFFGVTILFILFTLKEEAANNDSLISSYGKSRLLFDGVSYRYKTTGDLRDLTTETILSKYSRLLIVDGYGRLGNKMFQMASALGMARRSARFPAVAFEQWKTNLFEMFPNVKSKLHFVSDSTVDEIRQKSICKTCSFFFIEDEISLGQTFQLDLVSSLKRLKTNVILLKGYFQSYKYFDLIQEEIKFMFKLSKNVTETAVAKLNAIRESRDTQIVGIHVRRGDMTNDSFGYKPADRDFLDRAMTFMELLHGEKNVRFAVVSDSTSWCQEVLVKSNVYVFNGTSLTSDLGLLLNSDHLILTVGTFGWWVGYLKSSGTIVYQKDTAERGSEYDNLTMNSIDDYYPEDWIAL